MFLAITTVALAIKAADPSVAGSGKMGKPS
jgi:hypothetical protein